MNRTILGAVVAGIVYWLIQAAWFTVFSGPWIAGLGYSPERIADMQKNVTPAPYMIALVCNIVMAYVLGWFMHRTGEVCAGSGMKLGAIAWLGFIATAIVTEQIFEARPGTFMAVSAGAPLVGLLVMGAIQGAFLSRGRVKASPAQVAG